MGFLPENRQVHQHVAAIRYVLDPAMDLIWEEWTGEVSREDLAMHWQAILKQPEVMNCRRTLVDLTRARMNLRGSDLHNMIEALVIPELAGRSWITAIIVSSDFQFGISRQYGAYAELYSTDQIFKDVASALAWIRGRHHSPTAQANLLRAPAGCETWG